MTSRTCADETRPNKNVAKDRDVKLRVPLLDHHLVHHGEETVEEAVAQRERKAAEKIHLVLQDGLDGLPVRLVARDVAHDGSFEVERRARRRRRGR